MEWGEVEREEVEEEGVRVEGGGDCVCGRGERSKEQVKEEVESKKGEEREEEEVESNEGGLVGKEGKGGGKLDSGERGGRISGSGGFSISFSFFSLFDFSW